MADWKERLSPRKVAVALIAVAAIVHLVFNYVHTNALLLLENEICGFLMFMFVLMGLVSLFQATRIKTGEALGKYVGAAVCLITDFFGWKLVEIYRYALANQRALEAGPVKAALRLSVGLMAVFALAAVLLVADALVERLRARHG